MAQSPKQPTSRRYRGRTKEELREERRARLLRSGLELMGSDGYPNTSIERLCAHARVTTRHFYEHFRSREELLTALFDAFIEDALTVVMERLRAGEDDDPVERVLDALRGFARLCMNNPTRARLALIETVGVSRELESRRRDVIRHFAEVIAGAAGHMADRGILAPADYRLAGVALVGATNELLVEWLSGDTGLDADQMERQLTGIFRAIIGGTRSGQAPRGATPATNATDTGTPS